MIEWLLSYPRLYLQVSLYPYQFIVDTPCFLDANCQFDSKQLRTYLTFALRHDNAACNRAAVVDR